MKQPGIKSGSLLYADPLLHDAFFGRAVILVASHNDQGTVGFIVNKKLDVTLNDILPESLSVDFEVYYGGPVCNDTLYFIHSIGNHVPDSIPVGKKIFWGGDFSFVAKLIENHEADAAQVKFFIGYSGWAEGQLAEELHHKSWIAGNESSQFIFDYNACNEAWKMKMNKMGNKYAVWANFPQNPSMN